MEDSNGGLGTGYIVSSSTGPWQANEELPGKLMAYLMDMASWKGQFKLVRGTLLAYSG